MRTTRHATHHGNTPSREQGEQVRPLECNRKTPFVQAGVFALLAGLLRDRGSGASARLVVVAFATGLILALCAVPALAAGPASPFGARLSPSILTAPLASPPGSNTPTIGGELHEEEVYATRAHIDAEVVENGYKGTWRGEYAPAEGGHEPVANSPSWKIAGSGELHGLGGASIQDLTLGTVPTIATHNKSAVDRPILHHLKSGTHYYARFVVEGTSPTVTKTERTFEFTTLPAGKPEIPYLEKEGPASPTTAVFVGQIDGNELETEYHFEYTTTPGNASSWMPFTSGGSGSISVAEDYADLEAKLTGLAPETTYYVRVRASNGDGAAELKQWEDHNSSPISLTESFTTPTAKPHVGPPLIRNVTAASAHTSENFPTEGFETSWRLEYATSETGAWTPFASGVISTERATAEEYSNVSATLSGLAPGKTYYVRLFAENANGSTTSTASTFTTSGKPTAATFPTHALHGETVRVLGSVDPGSVPTSDEQTITVGGASTGGTFTLTFEGQTTAAIPYDAARQTVYEALAALPNKPQVDVEGSAGGPYTAYFFGSDGGVSEPQMVADASGLSPSGTVTVSTMQEGGVAYDARYHFEYVPQGQFEKPGGEGGFAEATSTPVVDVGSGDSSRVVGEDLPGLKAGGTYDFRLVATSTAPGNPVVDGEAHTLTVPVAAPVEAPAACPNAALRTGPSAGLPDCRAYEQVTPVDKEGSQELFQYGDGATNGVLVSEAGDRVLLEARAVNYGSGPDAGGSPYIFSRDPGKGWQMTAGSPQPETGVALLEPALFSSELTQAAFSSKVDTSNSPAGESKNIEYKYGPLGGPYLRAASVPADVANSMLTPSDAYGAWVGASQDFSKLIFETPDHSLLGSSTGTKSGTDLYEYVAGEMRRLNIGIGACGAQIAKGQEEGSVPAFASSPHAVSEDGSRVFFEAVPGGVCSEPSHLYVRVNGSETVDIGAYKFFAANAQGTQVLLDRRSGDTEEVFLDDTGSADPQPKLLLSSPQPIEPGEAIVSEDMSSIYFFSSDLTPEAVSGLYHYDVPDEKLSFVATVSAALMRVSPDGRYFYFNGGVAGVPSGAGQQVFRYDSVENVIECISCASSFDPEPKLGSYLGGRGGAEGPNGREPTQNGLPNLTLMSANGDFAFFDTPAALVPQDTDGELAPESVLRENQEYESPEFSPSSDVYEWRKDGIDGCAQLQGCLALISSGRGGVLNMLLGSTPSGNDVFIYTQSQLAPSDTDAAGDIYDVRLDGGFPPPARGPVECEGDACSTPASAPNDATPSSLTSAGTGNLAPAATATPTTKPKPKKAVKKKTVKKKAKKRGKKAKAKRAKRARDDRKGS
jgi:hypothetical protein